VLHRRDDPVERLDRGDDVVVREHHALRRAGRARGEDQFEDLLGGRPRPRRLSRLPVGRERRVVRGRLGAQRLDGGRREVVETGLAGVRGVAAGAEDQVPGRRRGHDPLDGLRRHAQVERDEHEAGGHRAVVRGRELGHRWRPRQDPIAGLEIQGAEAPGRDPGPALQLAEAPLGGRAVVASERKRAALAVPVHGRVEQIEQRRHSRTLPMRGRILRPPTVRGGSFRGCRADADRVPCQRNDHPPRAARPEPRDPAAEWC
jgi:hypothetical protein